MLKDVICKLDYSNFEEIAIVLFGLAFFMIIFGTFWLKRETVDRYSSIPLSDNVVDPRRQMPDNFDRKEV